MLVLMRQVNQRIRIGHTIIVTVTEVKGGKVKIGIDAPKDLEVHREEIYDEIYPNGKAGDA